jgi:hypothetical protein
MKHEYHEGPEAVEKVEKMMKQLFRAPKSTVKPTRKPVKETKKVSR